MSIEFPQKYEPRLTEIIKQDHETIHIYNNIADNKLFSLSESFDIGNYTGIRSLLREKGIVSSDSLNVLEVFCERINEGIISGTSGNSLSTDISAKLPDMNDFGLCHLHAFFLRDEKGKITDIHYNIRPYTPKETFDRDILNNFSSDKNPKIFSKRCRHVIDSNPDKDIAFIQFDIERFKLINETYGVDKGDELLQFINDSLALVCSEEQPFCRLTADVFMIVTPFNQKDELIPFIRKLESMLCGYNGMEYRLIFGVSIVDDRTLHTRRHGDNASLARQLMLTISSGTF